VSCVERRGTELGMPGSRTPYIQTDVAINQVSAVGVYGSRVVQFVGTVRWFDKVLWEQFVGNKGS